MVENSNADCISSVTGKEIGIQIVTHLQRVHPIGRPCLKCVII